MDFIAVEMRHFVFLASASPTLGRRSPRKSHISSVQTPPLLQNPLHGIAGRDLWAATQLFNTKECFEEQGTEIRW